MKYVIERRMVADDDVTEYWSEVAVVRTRLMATTVTDAVRAAMPWETIEFREVEDE